MTYVCVCCCKVTVSSFFLKASSCSSKTKAVFLKLKFGKIVQYGRINYMYIFYMLLWEALYWLLWVRSLYLSQISLFCLNLLCNCFAWTSNCFVDSSNTSECLIVSSIWFWKATIQCTQENLVSADLYTKQRKS